MAASLGFLAWEFRNGLGDLSWSDIDKELCGRWLIALFLYLVGLSGVHVAWGLVVGRAESVGFVRPSLVSAKAQVAKYVPGNVAHLAGRQVLASRQGWAHGSAAAASIVEIVGLVLAGLMIVVAGLALGVRVDVDMPGRTSILLLAGAAAIAIVALVVLARRFRPMLAGVARSMRGAPAAIVAVYVAFLAIAGVAQWLLLEGAAIGPVIVGATAAWLIGFLTPGVPGGVGVREAVLAGALALDPAVLAIGLVGFRMATVLSDLIAFVVGSALARGVRDA